MPRNGSREQVEPRATRVFRWHVRPQLLRGPNLPSGTQKTSQNPDLQREKTCRPCKTNSTDLLRGMSFLQIYIGLSHS